MLFLYRCVITASPVVQSLSAPASEGNPPLCVRSFYIPTGYEPRFQHGDSAGYVGESEAFENDSIIHEL